MKKIATLVIPILLLSLLAACAAPIPLTATSTPRPTDTPPPGVIGSKVEDVVGVWKSRYVGTEAYMHFKPDGTFNLTKTVEDLESTPYVTGKFWFEGIVFHVDDDGCHDPAPQQRGGG